MTIPKLTPYTGEVANPDGSQTQSEFTTNMFNQLSYEANLATELDATIDGMNNAVDEVNQNAAIAERSASAAEAAASSAGYKGLWPDTGGSAEKGDIYQTQVGGTPTGEYYTALKNTSVDPVGDNVNWKRNGDVNRDNLSDYTDIVYKASGGNSAVENMVAGIPLAASIGDMVKAGNTTFIKTSESSPNTIGDFEVIGAADIRDFGASTLSDNSAVLSLISSVSKKISVKGGNYNFNSFDVPSGVGIEIDEDSSLTLTQDSGLTFELAKYSEVSVTTTGGKGSKTFTVDDGSSFNPGEKILMVYRDDVTDPYYASIAQNPNEYGWQAQVLTIKLVTANTIVTEEPLLFNLKGAYNNTIRKIVTEKTKITGGTLVNGTNSSFHNGPVDNLTLKDVKIDCADSLGMRFIRCAFLSVVDSRVTNVNGNGGLFIGYGVVASGVVDTEFDVGKNGDAMLIWFAGSNNCISQRNKFLGNDMIGSLYFGAKTWNMQSVDDEFYGGKYGALTNFGSRDLKFVRPRMMGQSLAGLFLEQSQHVTVDSPRMKQDLLISDVQTQGGVVLKDCDFSIKIINPEIETAGGRSISVFNSPSSEVIRNDMHFLGGTLKGGRFQLECPVANLKIKDMTSEKDISSFFGYDFSENGEIVGNKVTDGKISLRSMRYSTIYDNEADANGGPVAIELTGSTRFCMLRRNVSKNADLAFSVPSNVTSRYSTAIYNDNIDINCASFIDNGVGFSTSFKPSLGVEAPRNFFVPITNSDFTTAQTVAGYRSKGNSATDETAWVRVLANEDLV